MKKARPYRKRYGKRKYNKGKRGMQRITTVRWPRRNIGGDRARCKLFYVTGRDFHILQAQTGTPVNMAFNLGAHNGATLTNHTVHAILGDTPNMQQMSAFYTRYRIRGIALKLTYWQTSGVPVLLFTNAATSQTEFQAANSGPTPAFPAIGISTTPEQRWCKYRVCGATSAGAKPTTLKAYYSVNKVYGPDAMVKNDETFTGHLSLATPYWSTADTPDRGPWLQFGITTLSGAPAAVQTEGVMKIEATVYAEFFGRRSATQ